MFNYFKNFIKTISDLDKLEKTIETKTNDDLAGEYKPLVIKTIKEYLPNFYDFHGDDIRYADPIHMYIPYSDMLLLGIQIKNIQFLFSYIELTQNSPVTLILVDANDTWCTIKEIDLLHWTRQTSESHIANFLKDNAGFSSIFF